MWHEPLSLKLYFALRFWFESFFISIEKGFCCRLIDHFLDSFDLNMHLWTIFWCTSLHWLLRSLFCSVGWWVVCSLFMSESSSWIPLSRWEEIGKRYRLADSYVALQCSVISFLPRLCSWVLLNLAKGVSC